ncbi:hypothetical protein EPR50_G00183860 [Perca flavescens]|uniref:Bulb-type lectin domain-containing protein n=1 Tax=Perca flavescens TaxID=8167 RepID=A0A484C835_PERFV|nr:mannose-specific lectin-like [Perca flavescens]XP_039638401.1 mannose-specific lectin-like [Perca fluviatilis]TDH00091.1 hypothetical protein EPR50_G00183860 [Perca flavescens]
MKKNFLSKNEQLFKDELLVSNNGKWQAIFQGDGNFVVYGDSKPVWASGTNGSDRYRVIMQADGNLVMYNNNNQAVWSTNTYLKEECEMCRLVLTDSGKLELIQTVPKKVWSS